MRLIKKLDWYLLKSFLGLFLMTFLICVFILLMQFVWMHVDDLVGKGVAVSVLAEFFVYAATSVVPLALPLAILLASLMTFGNLGEKFELTAMKAAGISLFRIMRPLIIAIGMLSVGAFFFSNNVLPKSQVKLWTLIFSLRQASPELDIPAGEFCDKLPGYNIYVRHKSVKTGMLYDMMIYDFSEGFNNASVVVADSGKIYFTADNRYLLLKLYNGESFENLSSTEQNMAASDADDIPYRRESFAEKQLLIDFSSEFNRYDESLLDDQHVSKNVSELYYSIDSVKGEARVRSREQSTKLVEERYMSREQRKGNQLSAVEDAELREFHPDSLYASFAPYQKERAMNSAVDRARNMRDVVEYNCLLLDDQHSYIRKHQIELYRKFTLAFACLIFFFIGAPLGAIIRKGGLGAPVVISVVMFIIYYIIDNAGYKMAREALWPMWAGMCLSSAVLLPIGIFLTYKAATDSALLNPEAWIKAYEIAKKRIQELWIRLKKHSRTSKTESL